MDDLRVEIEAAFERRSDISPQHAEPRVKEAVTEAIALLDAGTARVAEPVAGGWIVNDWLKKAVLLSFRLDDSQVMEGGFTRYFDKVPTKYATMDDGGFRERGVRVVPPAVVRRGAYIAPDVVLMPSYVNLGAYVDRGTMVDTWATVGSCAQIGRNRPSVRGRRHRGSAGTAAGESDDHRGRLLHRGPLRDRRGAWWSSGARWSRWGSTSARARESTTASPERCRSGGFPRARSSSPAAFPPKTAGTVCIAQSS